jgi:hypothetical protein
MTTTTFNVARFFEEQEEAELFPASATFDEKLGTAIRLGRVAQVEEWVRDLPAAEQEKHVAEAKKSLAEKRVKQAELRLRVEIWRFGLKDKIVCDCFANHSDEDFG